ncbi:MAG: hypothetical protein ABJN65_08875 [Parasphingorhabdus sp.]
MTLSDWQRAAGPGLLFSGSAIGISHLVQSTRAGAMFGLGLLGVILFVNIIKYPAFRFGMDYAHATRKTLIGGYRELGPWALVLYILMVLAIGPIGLAAVSATTAAIFAALTGVNLSIALLTSIAIAATVTLLMIVGYSWLDQLNKLLIAFLTIATITATVLVLPRVKWGSLGNFDWSIDPLGLLFVVALAGYMPNAMGSSVALSLWTLQSQEDEAESEHLPIGAMRAGFLTSYGLTAILALCFCIMGAGVMHSAGVAPETGAAVLASQIIDLYRETLGPVPAMLAAISALCVMATTMIAAFDGGARTLGALHQEYIGNVGRQTSTKGYFVFLLISAALAIIFLVGAMRSFSAFIDLVASISFIAGAALALMNHLVMTRCDMPEDARPTRGMRALSLTGIVIMSTMALMFFVLKLG